MSGFFAILFLLILPFVFFYSFRRPEIFKIKNQKNPKGQWSRTLFSAWWFAAWVLSLAMVGVFSKPLPEAEKQEIVRQVAAEMNAEPDAKAIITVQDDGVVVIDPVSAEPFDIRNDEAIVESAGVPVKWTEDSTDPNNLPKKIYGFNEKGTIGAQVELSNSQIIVAWMNAKDDADTISKSADSANIAKKITHALLGVDGEEMVNQVAAGASVKGFYAGYKVLSATCGGGFICSIKIERPEPKYVNQAGRNWVMENFVAGQKWSPNDWIKRFGTWEELPVIDMNPDIMKKYYFKSIDMTVTVNALKGEAMTWSSGKK